MKTTTLIKILVFFFTITLIINYGMHTITNTNAEEVRESAYEYVNQHCQPTEEITYNNQIKQWQPNINIT